MTCSPRCTRRPAAATASSRSRSRRTLRATPTARSPPPATYWQAVDRPNVMIKIPGTPEGVGAIEEAIYEGININVTLLFAVEAYEAVARGIHPRARAPSRRGQVTRRQLGRIVLRLARGHARRQAARRDRRAEASKLKGTAALANARAAYARFMEIFSGERWDTLAAAGAAVPASALGLDGRQEPGLPGHALRRSAGRPATPSTRCRWRRSTPSPTTARFPAQPRGSIRAPSWPRCKPPGST